MRFVQCEVKEGEFGVGLVPNIYKNWESYIPSFELGHDLIEHGTKESGEVYQEFQALGAWLFTSNFGRNRESRIFPMENLMLSSIETTIDDAIGNIIEIPDTPKFYITKKESDKIALLIHGVVSEMQKQIDREGEEDENESSRFFLANRDALVKHIAYGFVKAKKRYAGEHYGAWQTREKLDSLFNRQERQAIAQHIEDGGSLTVTIAYSINDAYVYKIMPSWW